MPDVIPLQREEIEDGLLVRWTAKVYGTEIKYVTDDKRPFKVHAVFGYECDGRWAEGAELVNADGQRMAVSLWYHPVTHLREEAE